MFNNLNLILAFDGTNYGY